MKKKLRKGGFFTDIHFGRKSNSPEHNQDCLDYIEWFRNKVIEHECDYLAFLGDWNENRSSLNINTLNYAYQGAKIINDIGLPVYFLIGNHDLYYRNSREIHSVIHHDQFNNFRLIDEPTIVDDIIGNVLFCPYLFHSEYPSLTEYLNIPNWAGHFEFQGFIITGYNIKMPTGPNAKDFKGPKNIFSGHFHKRQKQGNVQYIGNCFPMDFGDVDDNKRGMMVYDHETNKKIFEDWKECPKYTKTKLSDLIENSDNILAPKTHVNCIVDVQLEHNENIQLKKHLSEHYNLRDIKLEDSHELQEALEDNSNQFHLEKLNTIDEMVLEMLNHIDVEDIDNKLLISEYKAIKESTHEKTST